MIPLVADYLSLYAAITGGRFQKSEETFHGWSEVCIPGNDGPSTNVVDKFTDRAFLLTHYLAYVVVARYKYVQRAHVTGAKHRSVWCDLPLISP